LPTTCEDDAKVNGDSSEDGSTAIGEMNGGVAAKRSDADVAVKRSNGTMDPEVRMRIQFNAMHLKHITSNAMTTVDETLLQYTASYLS
jgi:hypothetical protein